MMVSAYFQESGTPKTGLSPTVVIRDLSDNSVVVNGAAMSEVGNGYYKYDFTAHNRAKEYVFLADSVTLTGVERYASGNINSSIWKEVIDVGYTAEEVQRLMTGPILGKLSGVGTGIERFRNIADTKDRVVGTIDGSFNRTNIILDAST